MDNILTILFYILEYVRDLLLRLSLDWLVEIDTDLLRLEALSYGQSATCKPCDSQEIAERTGIEIVLLGLVVQQDLRLDKDSKDLDQKLLGQASRGNELF